MVTYILLLLLVIIDWKNNWLRVEGRLRELRRIDSSRDCLEKIFVVKCWDCWMLSMKKVSFSNLNSLEIFFNQFKNKFSTSVSEWPNEFELNYWPVSIELRLMLIINSQLIWTRYRQWKKFDLKLNGDKLVVASNQLLRVIFNRKLSKKLWIFNMISTEIVQHSQQVSTHLRNKETASFLTS